MIMTVEKVAVEIKTLCGSYCNVRCRYVDNSKGLRCNLFNSDLDVKIDINENHEVNIIRCRCCMESSIYEKVE